MDVPRICTQNVKLCERCLGEAHDQNVVSARNEAKITRTEGSCRFNNILENAESDGLGNAFAVLVGSREMKHLVLYVHTWHRDVLSLPSVPEGFAVTGNCT